MLAPASICEDRFPAQVDATVRIGEQSKVSSWDRGGFIERGGFAVMPDGKTTDSDVARTCAESLTKPAATPQGLSRRVVALMTE